MPANRVIQVRVICAQLPLSIPQLVSFLDDLGVTRMHTCPLAGLSVRQLVAHPVHERNPVLQDRTVGQARRDFAEANILDAKFRCRVLGQPPRLPTQ